MKIRRYFGYDCNSIQGFNNGCYIDDDPIEVRNESEAMDLCYSELKERYGLENNAESQDNIEDWENGYQFVLGFNDEIGNPLSEEKWQEMNEFKETGSYSYVFITYEEVSEESEK